MRRYLSSALMGLVLAVWVATPAAAVPITYNFEAPNFTAGQVTPLVNVAPNIGPGTFLTTFTGNPTADGFLVTTGAPPNPLLTGQHLIDLAGVADTLVLTFSAPVTSLQVDFGFNVLVTGPLGFFSLVTPVGSISQFGGNVGGAFQGGTLIFTSAVPFLSAQLRAFDATAQQVFFAIDDLILESDAVSVVPEPVTGVLVLTGLGVLARRRLRRRTEE